MIEEKTKRPVTAIIVGGGHRSIIYGDYSFKFPDELKIVGIADPNRERCLMAAKRYGFSEEFCFDSAESLAKVPKFADAIINGTMDHQHYETAVPLLKLGYDMLLEKPFAINEGELRSLMKVVEENHNRVMICHVLRYTPFYRAIKKKISDGELGEIINIQMSEHVSYHHLTNSYVRGKWANSDICKTSMLLAKSCHDIDLMTWFMSDYKPVAVSSFGTLRQFTPDKQPEGATDRCMHGCPYLETCNYSSKRIYLEHERWTPYVWQQIEGIENPTQEQKVECLTGDNPYDRCVYKCDNNVVDRQSLLVSFSNGATGTHSMVGGTARSMRKIHVVGTLAEIEGNFEDEKLIIRYVNPSEESGCIEEEIDFNMDLTMGHGGGDDGLTADFVNYIRTGEQSISCTAIENSIAGHLIIFKADESRENGGAVQQLIF